MSTIATYPYESCPKKCKNSIHGDRISSALINGTVTDDKIAAFIAKTCRSFAYVLDGQVSFSFLNSYYFSTTKQINIPFIHITGTNSFTCCNSYT